MNEEKQKLLDIASVFLITYSYVDMFASGSQYFDSLSWTKKDILGTTDVLGETVTIAARMEEVVNRSQKALCEISKCFEESLKNAIHQPAEIQNQLFNTFFDIKDFDTFWECCIDNIPSYFDVSSVDFTGVFICWLSVSYHAYLTITKTTTL